MNEFVKIALISVGAFGILTLANVTAESIYTNSKVGIDKKMLLKAGLVGIALTIALMQFSKK